MPAQTYIIPNDKLTRHLLNPRHRVGGSKAKFVLARGFAVTDLKTITTALLEHAERHWPGRIYPEPWDHLHELIGAIVCPDGTPPRILAVWKVEAGQSFASFVTACPFHSGSHHT